MALSNSPLISIVDDDQSVRTATQGLVRSLGYAAVAFESAEAFLASGRVEDTSCLITDLHMPGLSGVELQEHLIERGNRLPIIFITAFAEENVRAQVLANGAIDFLSKPFSEEKLIKCLDFAFAAARILPTRQ